VRRRRVMLALAAVAIGALAVVIAGLLVRSDRARPWPADPHALRANIPPAKLHRILEAADSVAATTPSAELIAQGRRLFRDPSLFQQGLSCQSCHTDGGADPDLGTQVHPLSAGDFTGPRDPPALWGVDETAPYFWTGSVATLDEVLARVIKNFFKDGDPTPERIAALDAYLRSLQPPTTPFDLGTMSPAALRGQRLFQGKAGCMSCHGGPLFTDNRLHNTLVPQAPGGTDPGAPNPKGAFNTPALRDVANTAPYMHNGVLPTLRDVVVFYNTRASTAPLGLTDAEIDDLVAYLNSL
jgi:cytochrome c peroxidase